MQDVLFSFGQHLSIAFLSFWAYLTEDELYSEYYPDWVKRASRLVPRSRLKEFSPREHFRNAKMFNRCIIFQS